LLLALEQAFLSLRPTVAQLLLLFWRQEPVHFNTHPGAQNRLVRHRGGDGGTAGPNSGFVDRRCLNGFAKRMLRGA